jgi:serine/threonine protein phosphatase PrpC
MAPQIDAMVKSGLIDPETGRNHPDRNCLTSVILGDRVARSDCPRTPFTLEVGDIVIVTSDGLQYLEEPRIEKILTKYRRRKSAEIAEHLLAAINELADPDQDNVSFAVIKLNHNKPVTQAVRRKPVDLVGDTSARATRVVSLGGSGYGDSAGAASAAGQAAAGRAEERSEPIRLVAGGK